MIVILLGFCKHHCESMHISWKHTPQLRPELKRVKLKVVSTQQPILQVLLYLQTPPTLTQEKPLLMEQNQRSRETHQYYFHQLQIVTKIIITKKEKKTQLNLSTAIVLFNFLSSQVLCVLYLVCQKHQHHHRKLHEQNPNYFMCIHYNEL